MLLSPYWMPRAHLQIGNEIRIPSETVAFDTVSIYSAPSMLSLHSAIDADSGNLTTSVLNEIPYVNLSVSCSFGGTQYCLWRNCLAAVF